jgi:HEAT repeat protein
VLGLIRDERAIEPLCQRLWDDNANVVCSAAEALGEIGSAAAVPHLLAVYDKIEDVRLPSIEALGKIGDPSALEHL